jgi:hypothetical protein
MTSSDLLKSSNDFVCDRIESISEVVARFMLRSRSSEFNLQVVTLAGSRLKLEL